MTKSSLSKIRTFIGLSLLTTSTLSAGTYTVTTTADSGPGSLRQAILSADTHGGGDITFFKVSGVIGLLSPLPPIAQNTFIIGPANCSVTISGGGNYALFSVNNGVSCVLSDLIIANGSATGYYSPFANPTQASGVANAGQLELRNCTILNCTNYLSDGAAVYNSGTLQMIGCMVMNCGSSGPYAGVDGGAVYNSGILTMQNCAVSNCVGTEGGGIFNTGTSTITNCIISGCYNDYSEGNAGGIYNYSGSMTLANCTITNCEAGYDGGGIFSRGDLTVKDTTITGNNAIEGGGMFLSGGTNLLRYCTISNNEGLESAGGGIKNLTVLTLLGCTVSGNVADYGGAGIENLNTLYLTNCTVSGNVSGYGDITNFGGGGIGNSTNDPDGGEIITNAVTYLIDCTVASNSAGWGPGGGILNEGGTVYAEGTIIANNGSNDFSGELNSGGYNLMANTNDCALGGNCTSNLYNVDPLLGPLQNNGGHTFTQALLPGSPAINAGPVSGPPYFDQRGVPRQQGTASDIGAFQIINHHIHFVTLTRAGCGYQVGLSGVPGLNYTIQRSSSLNGPWTTLTNIATGSNGDAACMDANPPGNSAFYRSVFP